MTEKYLLGVTGSMGCGKSYTCNKLVEIGQSKGIDITHIDFDKIRRTNTQPYHALTEILDQSKGLVLMEWALLIEDKLLSQVNNNILLVTSDYNTQLNRLIGGDLSKEEVIRRINSQLSNREKENKIRTIQEQSKSGRLYILDTTNNPEDNNYELSLEQIIKGMR
ncbi:MAG: dephospho-CoA kinase [Candidatus Woesearchaeota archaeon]